jgi:hypothetical protein
MNLKNYSRISFGDNDGIKNIYKATALEKINSARNLQTFNKALHFSMEFIDTQKILNNED